MNTRQFHIGDILSITHDYLLSPRHMTEVYDILNHMTGRKLMTHFLLGAGDTCAPQLLQQLPFLNQISKTEIGRRVDELRALEPGLDEREPERFVQIILQPYIYQYGEQHPVRGLGEQVKIQ